MSDTSDKKHVVISRATAKRLIKDIKELKKEPLTGIYYIHDETDILKGQAMIIGPDDTPYHGGYYLFKFSFPQDYPHSPPKLTFCTNDGYTRMHPNMYKNGKVCLSLLNSWQGQDTIDAWTGCQTISSVLLTIRSIMTNGPLQHEPGCGEGHRDYFKYSEIVRFRNIGLSIHDILNDSSFAEVFPELLTIAKKDFIDNFENKLSALFKAIEAWNKKHDSVIVENGRVYTSMYNMHCKISYDGLQDKLIELQNNLKK